MTTKKRIAESTELIKIKGTYAHWQERAQTAREAAEAATAGLEGTMARLASQLAAAESQLAATKARVETELAAAKARAERISADARRRADDADRRRELAGGRWKQEVRRLIEIRARRDWGSEWFQHVREYTVGRPAETSENEAASQAVAGVEGAANMAQAEVEIA